MCVALSIVVNHYFRSVLFSMYQLKMYYQPLLEVVSFKVHKVIEKNLSFMEIFYTIICRKLSSDKHRNYFHSVNIFCLKLSQHSRSNSYINVIIIRHSFNIKYKYKSQKLNFDSYH